MHRQRNSERGFTFAFVAIVLALLVGVAALTIDLASFYVARNEAQKAADSAALAGAKVFAESGCASSGTCSSLETAAAQRAIDIGNQNLIAGQPVNIQSGNVSFTMSNAQNPQITVQVQQTGIGTIFAAVFGITSGSVAATATAEAYNPSGNAGGPTYCTGCIRPWFMNNCDPDHISPTYVASHNCAGGETYLLNPGTYSVATPGCSTANGVVGEGLDIAIETQPTEYGAVDAGTGTTGYQDSITTCNTGQFTCGDTFNALSTTALQGFTEASVDALLNLPVNTLGAAVVPGNSPGNHPTTGQDWIDTTVCPPQIHAGALNPLVTAGILASDAPISTSNSVVTVLIYDALNQQTTGNVIVGFAQVFVTQVDVNGDVWGVILNLAGCGGSTGTCGGAGSISSSGAGTIPVRLISQ